MITARRFVIIASASGSGKTTLGRRLAARMRVPFVELDALVHGPNWQETPDARLQEQVRRIVRQDGWVIDGTYQRKLGTMALDAADAVVWLDLPLGLCLLRLVRRSVRRWRGQETLWNGNRETLAGLIGGPDSLFGYAMRSYFTRRRDWPRTFAKYPLVRLRTPLAVRVWLRAMEPRPRPPARVSPPPIP